jgi:hypothetical protein
VKVDVVLARIPALLRLKRRLFIGYVSDAFYFSDLLLTDYPELYAVGFNRDSPSRH